VISHAKIVYGAPRFVLYKLAPFLNAVRLKESFSEMGHGYEYVILTSRSTHFSSFRRRRGDCGVSQDCSCSGQRWGYSSTAQRYGPNYSKFREDRSIICAPRICFRFLIRYSGSQGRSKRGGMGACPPVIVGQFLSRRQRCSLGFPYSAPGPRWGLPSPPSVFLPPPLSKYLATPLLVLIAVDSRRTAIESPGRNPLWSAPVKIR